MKRQVQRVSLLVLAGLWALSAASFSQAVFDENLTLAGKVVDALGAPVADVCVVLCDQKTGVPLHKERLRPFTDAFPAGPGPTDCAFAVTDDQGRFLFEKIPAGEYRLIAQSWEGAKPIEGLFEVNGATVELHGVAEQVKASSEPSSAVLIRPLGTGVLRLDEELGNDDTLLLISTAPPRGDPILGFVAWGGAFARNLIGGNRMPGGNTTIRGLPAGKVYVTLFANDNNPGWGAAEFEIKPNATTVGHIPIVASWSNGHHTPPERLIPLCRELESLAAKEDDSIQRILKAGGIEMQTGDGMWENMRQISRQLNSEIKLPGGRKASLGDVLAAVYYIELQQTVKRRQEQHRQRSQTASGPDADAVRNDAVSYEEALVALHDELGRHYPCFELKGIDWKAVGRELLPLAKKVKTDEEFGLLCLELIARLEDSHAYLSKGAAELPSPPFPRWDPGFACLIDDRGQSVVYYVDKGGPAQAAGVHVGMTVLSMNGQPASEAVEACVQQVSRYAGYSSRRYLRYQGARWFTRQMDRGAAVMFEMEEPDGTRHGFRLHATLGVRYLPRLPVPIAGVPDSRNVSWKMLDGEIGYIYVRRIRSDLIDSLDRAVGELKNARGLIIDVRGNSGGGFDAAQAHRNFALDDQDQPQRPRFLGPMAMLLDARCISAGEGWASWFIANKRAKCFGQTTAGASSRKRTYTLANGLYKVTFPEKAYRGFLKRPIERRGLEPDVPLRQTARDLAAGRDTVLEAARQHLLESG